MVREEFKRGLSLEEDINFIQQLIDSLGESMNKLEGYSEKMDFDKFSETKKSIKEIQSKIGEVVG